MGAAAQNKNVLRTKEHKMQGVNINVVSTVEMLSLMSTAQCPASGLGSLLMLGGTAWRQVAGCSILG